MSDITKGMIKDLLTACILIVVLSMSVAFILSETDTENDTEIISPNNIVENTEPELAPAHQEVIKKEAPKKASAPGNVVGTEINSDNVFNGVNQVRYNLGLPILKRNSGLDLVALEKLYDMIEYDYWSHNNPTTGKKFHYWFADENGEYPYSYVGEILARNFSTIQETVNGWVQSPTHYAAMTSPNFQETGIAIREGIVVQIFAGKSKD